MASDLRELRDVVLDAAVRQLAAHGLHGTSIEAVAEEAAAPVETVQRWYDTVDALAIAAVSRQEDLGAETLKILEHASGLDILHAVKAMTEATQSAREPAVVFTSLVAGSVTSTHPARPWAVERYRWTRSLYSAAFRRDIDAGLIRSDCDPDLLARHLVAVLDGLQIQWLLEPDQVDLAQSVGAYVDGLIEAITTDTP